MFDDDEPTPPPPPRLYAEGETVTIGKTLDAGYVDSDSSADFEGASGVVVGTCDFGGFYPEDPVYVVRFEDGREWPFFAEELEEA